MTVLSDQQIYSLAMQAGFSASDAAIVTAIALAESSGNPVARNPSGATGLMQIMPFNWNLIGGNPNPTDPLTNMKMAYAVFKQRQASGRDGFSAWETYGPTGGGVYNKFLSRGQNAAYGGGAPGSYGTGNGNGGSWPDTSGAQTSGAGAGSGAGNAAGPSLAQQILDYANGFKGTPYVYGGSSPNGFDCSGLVQYVFGHYGVSLPRTSEQQANAGSAIDQGHAQPGDLVFFTSGGDTHHVGIYLGGGYMLDAPHTGSQVRIDNVQGFASEGDTVTFRRVLSGANDFNGVGSAFVPSSASNSAALGMDGMTLGQALLNAEPDIQNVAYQVASQGITNQNDMLALLMNTNWWKEHSTSQRDWEALSQDDPAQAAHVIQQVGMMIGQQAAAMGAHLTTGQVQNMAQFALATSYTNDSSLVDPKGLAKLLTGYVSADKGGLYSGEAGTIQQAAKSIANQYGVPLQQNGEDFMVRSALNQSLGDSATDTTLEKTNMANYFREQAKSMYPSLSKAIDAGMTTQDIAAPYISTMTRLLEQPYSSNNIDQYMSDPLIKKLLSSNAPASNSSAAGGTEPSIMPLWQFESAVKQDPRWLQTNNARDNLSSVGLQVLQDMGLSATGGNAVSSAGGASGG